MLPCNSGSVLNTDIHVCKLLGNQNPHDQITYNYKTCQFNWWTKSSLVAVLKRKTGIVKKPFVKNVLTWSRQAQMWQRLPPESKREIQLQCLLQSPRHLLQLLKEEGAEQTLTQERTTTLLELCAWIKLKKKAWHVQPLTPDCSLLIWLILSLAKEQSDVNELRVDEESEALG